MKCWICGKVADSGEHRIKKSDLIKIHGKGPYKKENSLVMVKGGMEIPVQGPNSKFLKYKKSLCTKCNGTNTQRFDNAYSKFIDHLDNNEKNTLRTRIINLGEIYGNDSERGQRNLYKYLVKSFGCRVVEAGRDVPRNLVEILNRQKFQTNLFITFAVNEDKVKYLPDDMKMVGNGDLVWSEKIDSEGNFSATYHEYYSYLHIYYWYNSQWDLGLGSRWLADSLYLYLGSFAPLSPEQREKAKEMKT